MKLFCSVLLYVYLEHFPPTYKDIINEEDRRRRDRRIPRAAMKNYYYSSFRHLFLSGNDQALLNATGHDHASFKKLLHIFKPVYDLYMWDPYLKCIRRKILDANGVPKGKPRDMTACGCLCLILMWYCTRGTCSRGLALLFGQTSTPMYKWLKFGRKVLLHVLSREKSAVIKLPTEEEVHFFCQVIAERYPVLNNV